MKTSFVVPLLCLFSATGLSAAEPPAPASGAPSALRQLSNSFASVFEKAAPSVVVIETRSSHETPVSGLPGGLEFFFHGPNGAPYSGRPEAEPPSNVGSGFVLSNAGHILTNNHVIANATGITVRLRDGRHFEAEVVGADERSDLAVLKIAAPDLVVAELGDSDAVKVGELAFAIGTPMELPYTFTFGIVSAKGRTLALGGHYDEFLQTDTSINPGNSGGPLCDIDGRVVGINTLISGVNRGVGFAIPINNAKTVADQLLTKGYVSRPWLGISIASLEDLGQARDMFPGVADGVIVRGIEPGAPAQRSPLIPGDVIRKVDGKTVALASDLQREILGKKIGQTVGLEVWRNGRTLRVEVPTGEQPDKFLRASARPAPAPPSKAAPLPNPSSPGIKVEDATPDLLNKLKIKRKDTGGVFVTEVEAFSASAVAGIEPGDIITEAGGKRILTKKDFDAVLRDLDNQRGILLLLERAGQKTFAILKP
jgi:Do/DeqQ family serine protease